MKLRPKRPARENAARLLPRLAKRFFQAGDRTVEDGHAAPDVHRFRVQAKRFRYALEYFAPCYGQTLHSYLELLKELQAALGALNDNVATRELLAGVLEPGNPPRRHKKLFLALDDRTAVLLEEFRGLWRAKFSAPALRIRWRRYLERPPLRRSKAPVRSSKQHNAAVVL